MVGTTPAQESPNLDLLRSGAVLAVLMSHILRLFNIAPPILYNLGSWGVLLFFVHTSLVLMRSLERQRVQSMRTLFPTFLVRRIFRIYPLSILIVAAVWLFHWPVGHLLHGGQFQAAALHSGDVLANLLLVQNLTGSPSILSPLWSLPYEMQMYLTLPFLYWVAVNVERASALFAIWFTAGAAALLAAPMIGDIFNYAPCFLSGVIAFKLSKRARRTIPYYLWPAFLAALSLAYLVVPTTPMSWLVCLALGVSIPRFEELPAGTLQRACQLVARYSYGVYLTHFICLWFAFRSFGPIAWWMSWPIFLTTATLAPVLLYHALEAPLIAVSKSLTSVRRPLQPAIAA